MCAWPRAIACAWNIESAAPKGMLKEHVGKISMQLKILKIWMPPPTMTAAGFTRGMKLINRFSIESTVAQNRSEIPMLQNLDLRSDSLRWNREIADFLHSWDQFTSIRCSILWSYVQISRKTGVNVKLFFGIELAEMQLCGFSSWEDQRGLET